MANISNDEKIKLAQKAYGKAYKKRQRVPFLYSLKVGDYVVVHTKKTIPLVVQRIAKIDEMWRGDFPERRFFFDDVRVYGYAAPTRSSKRWSHENGLLTSRRIDVLREEDVEANLCPHNVDPLSRPFVPVRPSKNKALRRSPVPVPDQMSLFDGAELRSELAEIRSELASLSKAIEGLIS